MVKLEILIAVLAFGFQLYAFIDCIQREDHQIKGLPKWGWLLFIFITTLGAAAYLYAGRVGARTPRERPNRNIQNPPKGPDDDPDFLKGL